jgi:hypothetical protein
VQRVHTTGLTPSSSGRTRTGALLIKDFVLEGEPLRKVLFLDDNQQRHMFFEGYNMRGKPGVSIRHAYTADQARAILADEDDWDEIWLDHDLTLEDYMKTIKESAKNGYSVAKYMAYKAGVEGWRMDKTEVIVHSWNDFAAEMMVEVLKDAGWSVRAERFPI